MSMSKDYIDLYDTNPDGGEKPTSFSSDGSIDRENGQHSGDQTSEQQEEQDTTQPRSGFIGALVAIKNSAWFALLLKILQIIVKKKFDKTMAEKKDEPVELDNLATVQDKVSSADSVEDLIDNIHEKKDKVDQKKTKKTKKGFVR